METEPSTEDNDQAGGPITDGGQSTADTDQFDTSELECNHCSETLGGETIEEYNRNLARHILDEHQDVASERALRYARAIVENRGLDATETVQSGEADRDV